MVLKLYANPQSTCGRHVALILPEKQVPYELFEANWAVIKGDDWLKTQPFSQMPNIDDGGFILFESRAIARYLATQYALQGNPPLLPDSNDAKTMALLDQAISVETANFDPSVSALAYEKTFKLWTGEKPEPILVEKYKTTLAGKMDGFERLLGKQKYMAGDSLTFVDIFYVPYGSMLAGLGYDHLTNETKYPNVASWFKEISSRSLGRL